MKKSFEVEDDIVQRCYNTFSWVEQNGKLTADQAKRILEILKEDDTDENTDRVDTDKDKNSLE
jgi:hypothetical protein